VKASDIAQAAAAATAVIGVVTSLAVTGVLGQAQRNHGNLLLVAFSIVLFAALWWTLAAVIPDTHPVLLSIGAGVFLIGLGFVIAAMIATQHDSERPSVSPDSYDSSKRVLKTTVKADGLAADKRIGVVEVSEEVDAPAIVIGSHGAKRGRALFEGSLSHDVAVHSRKPVLIVPPQHGPS
jgi:hypothetical protein